jgi:hypothetical protein
MRRSGRDLGISLETLEGEGGLEKPMTADTRKVCVCGGVSMDGARERRIVSLVVESESDICVDGKGMRAAGLVA